MPDQKYILAGTGTVGPPGPPGADGADGAGVPPGGTTGQVLSKTSNADGAVGWAAPGGGSNDPNAVKITGNQDIDGTKTFLDPPVLPADSLPMTAISGLDDALAAKLDDTDIDPTNVVLRTGNQNIAGTKTFATAPVVPDDSWSIADTNLLQEALDAKQDAADLAADVNAINDAGNRWPIMFLDPGDSTAGLDDFTVVLRRVTAAAAVVVTQLAEGGSTTDGTTFTTSSVNFQAGSLRLMYVVCGNAAAAAGLASTALGTQHGVTWTRIADVTTANGFQHAALFIGVGTASAGTYTVTPGGTLESFAYKIIEITGVNTTPVQVGTAQPASSSTTPGVTLAGVSGSNMVIGFISQQNSNAMTEAAGFTPLGTQVHFTTPTTDIACEYKLVGQNAVSWVGSGTVQRTVIAVEIAPA